MSIYGVIEHFVPPGIQATVLAAALMLCLGIVVRRQIAAAGGGASRMRASRFAMLPR